MYARGILFGKMKYELGDHSFVRCPDSGLVADLEFKTKGWVGGMYNAIGGTIKNEKTGETLYEFSGLWSDEMFVKNLKVCADMVPETHMALADMQKDWPQGEVLRCTPLQALAPTGQAHRRAGREGITEALEKDCAGRQREKPRSRYRREDKG